MNHLRWVFVLAAVLSVSCTNSVNPSTVPSSSGIPARIVLDATIGMGSAPIASIAATVLDAVNNPITGISVSFSTTSGFITSPAQATAGGVAEAFLSGVPTGSSATVTASAASGGQTATGTLAVQF